MRLASLVIPCLALCAALLPTAAAAQKTQVHHMVMFKFKPDATPAQIALPWVLRDPDLIEIPKAGRPEHIRQNRAAFDIQLTDHDLEKLDKTFPPPKRKIPLEML